MDARKRTFLLALVGLGLGVLALVGVSVLLMRGAAGAPAAQTSPKAEGADVEALTKKSSEAREAPPPESATLKAQAPAQPGRLEVLDGRVTRISCKAACYFESSCGFRTSDSCAAASCEGEFRKVNRSDFLIGKTNTCAELAIVPCEEACWRRGECAGEHDGDRACEKACVTIAQQRPRETYLENRCVLESACEALPTCGAIGAPALPAADAGG